MTHPLATLVRGAAASARPRLASSGVALAAGLALGLGAMAPAFAETTNRAREELSAGQPRDAKSRDAKRLQEEAATRAGGIGSHRTEGDTLPAAEGIGSDG